MTDFQAGASEELRAVIAGQHATTAPGDMTVIPHKGNITGFGREWAQGNTEEVRSDLQVNDIAQRGFTVPGSFQGDHRYGLYDIFIQMVMGNAWSAAVDINGTDIASVDATNRLTSVTANKFQDLANDVPCPVYLTRDGASPLSIPVIALSVENSNTELVIGKGNASGSNAYDGQFGVDLADVSAGDTVRVEHDGVLGAGNNPYYALMELAQTGIGVFHVLYGVMCTQWALNFQRGQDPTNSFNLMARDAAQNTATYGTGTNTAAGTFAPFSAGTDISHFGVGGVYSTKDPTDTTDGFFPRAFNFQVASAAVAGDPLGFDGPFDHEKDTVLVTGNFGVLDNLASRALLTRADANTEDSLFAMIQKTVDSVTKGYAYWLPRIKYDNRGKEGGGQGGRRTTAHPWQAAVDATQGESFKIARFADIGS